MTSPAFVDVRCVMENVWNDVLSLCASAMPSQAWQDWPDTLLHGDAIPGHRPVSCTGHADPLALLAIAYHQALMSPGQPGSLVPGQAQQRPQVAASTSLDTDTSVESLLRCMPDVHHVFSEMDDSGASSLFADVQAHDVLEVVAPDGMLAQRRERHAQPVRLRTQHVVPDSFMVMPETSVAVQPVMAGQEETLSLVPA